MHARAHVHVLDLVWIYGHDRNLVAQHLHFADTLPHLQQVQSCILDMFLDTVHAYTCNHFTQAKKDGHHGLKDVCKFGLESLYAISSQAKTTLV